MTPPVHSSSRIIHISDIHCTTNDYVYDVNVGGIIADLITGLPVANPTSGDSQDTRAKCSELVSFLTSSTQTLRADKILITGDLVDSGQNNGFDALARQCLIDPLTAFGYEVIVVPGNHDYFTMGNQFSTGSIAQGRDHFYNAFSSYMKTGACDAYPVDLNLGNGNHLILLDSLKGHFDVSTNSHRAQGNIGAQQMNWLRNTLPGYQQARRNGAKIAIALHHSPFELNGDLEITDAAEFLGVIDNNIDALLFGHTDDPHRFYGQDALAHHIPIISSENIDKMQTSGYYISVIDLECGEVEVYKTAGGLRVVEGQPSQGAAFQTVPQAKCSGLSRRSDRIDVFATDAHGLVRSAYWSQGRSWSGMWIGLEDPHYADRFIVRPGAPVSVISRFPEHLDLFVSGLHGGIYGTWYDDSTGWVGPWYRIEDPSYTDHFVVPPGAPITALSRFREHIDLFVTGIAGGIYGTWYDDNGSWGGHWYRIEDPAYRDRFVIPPGSPVTAVSRYREHIDLFVSGITGAIFGTHYDDNGSWRGNWYRIEDPGFADHFTIPPGAPVTALSRFREHLDLFVTGRNGAVYGTYYDDSTSWRGSWYRVEDTAYSDHFVIPPGSPVTAISRFRSHIDLFVVGINGGIYGTWYDDNDSWSGQWYRIEDPAYSDHFTVLPGSRVIAFSRLPDHMDLFVVGRQGGIYSTNWNQQDGWCGSWYMI